MMFVLNGSWMGLPVDVIPHEGTVRIGGCFYTSMADFLEMVERVLTDTPLAGADSRRQWLARIQQATIREKSEGEYFIVVEDAA